MAEHNANPSDDRVNVAGEVEEWCERLRETLYLHCTPFGDEIKTRLPETSLALLRYGHLYMMRAMATLGVEQKINFMRSAALLYAAKHRFESLTPDEDQLNRTLCVIEDLHNVIFDEMRKPRSGAIVLRETSDRAKKRLKQLRELQEAEILKMPRIHKDTPKMEMLRIQKEKIDFIRGLLEKTTEDYTVLMYYIADKCEKILGEPPHQFAIAGLGSLAKKEVTLHSAFKYNIILDENVRRAKIDNNDMEYYRWFALLFNVILTGLGEKPINSVLVEELESWYHDLYTPSGVGVDGLMPWIYRDCGEWIVIQELILPLADYAIYFFAIQDEESELKLKSLLRQHRFIYGSRSIYDQYVDVVSSNLATNKCIAKEIPFVLSDNTNQLIEATPFVRLGHPQFKNASFFYRPISDCLSYIGRFFGWSCFSGFEILAKLKTFSSDLSFICGHSPKCHQTELALAAACELRMKVYAIGNGSRARVTSGVITKFIDWQSLFVCMERAWMLTRYLDSVRIYADKGMMPDLKTCKLFAIWDERQENILKEQLDNLERNRGMSKHDKTVILLNCVHHTAKVKVTKFESAATRNNELESAKRYLLRHPGYIENTMATGTLISIYQDQNKPAEALKVCEDFFKSLGDKTPPYNALIIRHFQIKALERTRSFSGVFNYCEKALRQNDDVAAQMVFKKARVLSQIQQNTITIQDARIALADLVKLAVYEGGKTNDLRSILQFIEDIFIVQYQCNWIEDAFETCKFAYVFVDSKVMAISMEDIPSFAGAAGAQCLLIMARRASDGHTIRRLTSEVFDICSRIEFNKNIGLLFSQALQLVFDKQHQTPSVHNISLLNSCLPLIPSTMNSNPAVKEVRRYLKVYTKTTNEINKFLDSSANGDCHGVQHESELATNETAQNSEKVLGATAKCVDIITPTPPSFKVRDVPGSSAGASMGSRKTGTHSPVAVAAGTIFEGTTSPTTAPCESDENSDNVRPFGRQGIFNLIEILKVMASHQNGDK